MATIFDASGYLEAKTNLYNSTFSTSYSEAEMKDLINDAGMTLEEHYQQFGEQELADAGVSFDPTTPFDSLAYLSAKTEMYNNNPAFSQNMSVAEMAQTIEAAGMTPLEHYQLFGEQELAEAGITFPASSNEVTLDPAEGYYKPNWDSVDTINVTADGSVVNGLGGQDTQINAEDITGATEYNSVRSQDDLLITDLTTEGVGATADMHFGMDHTGSSDHMWEESNMTVLFEQDYLTNSQTQDGYAFEMLDQAGQDASDTNAPLVDFPLDGVQFKVDVNGTTEVFYLDATADDLAGIETQEQMVEFLNEKLDAELADTGLTGQFSVGGNFSDGDGRTSQQIILQLDGGAVTDGFVDIVGGAGAGNVYWNQGDLGTVTQPVTTNVELTKVGESGDGGGLIIGSMNKGNGDNSLDSGAVTNNNTVAGIQQFNVTVHGDAMMPSSLSYLRSTNNVLETVNIDSDNGGADSYADLIIGNSQTLDLSGTAASFGTLNDNAGALRDVATLDASNFDGNLTVHAGLTDEFIAKYAVDGPEGQEVTYTGGNGNDTIDLAISANVAAASQEGGDNLNLTVNGGAGDDVIDIDGATAAGPGNNGVWTLHGGAGDDTFNLAGTEDGSTDATATVGNATIVLDSGLGNETIIDFSHAGTSTEVPEEQTFDFAGYDLQDGESVTLNIAGQTVTYTYTADAIAGGDDADNDGEVGGTELAAVVVNAITNATNVNSNFTAANGGTSTLTVTASDNGNIGPITAEIGGDVVEFTTTIDGVTDEQVDGNDVLDFSSFNLEALVVETEANFNSTTADAYILGSGGTEFDNAGAGNGADADTFIVLVNQAINGTATNEYNVIRYSDNDADTSNQVNLGSLTFMDGDGDPALDELANATDANFIINDADAGVFA